MNKYELCVPEDFFESKEIKYLESLPNGCLFTNILLQLYLKSLDDDGRITLNHKIPLLDMIAVITGHKKETVEEALNAFSALEIIEKDETGNLRIIDYLGCWGIPDDAFD